MLDYIKKLITPDMVSFWVPSGLSRAQDLIRGNHGQCYGTHPNVPVISKPAGANLVLNGGFDSDTTGWTPGGSAILTSELGGKVGNCLMIKEGGSNDPRADQIITVVAGKVYRYRGYAKAGTELEWRGRLYDISNSASIWLGDYQSETAGDWSTGFDHTFIAPSGCTNIRVYLYQRARSGEGKTLYFDEISLHEVKPSLINPSVGWHFDNVDDKIDCGAPILVGTGDFTISAWFNVSSLAPDADYICGNYGAGNHGGVEFYLRTDTKALTCYRGTAVSSTEVPAANQWHHGVAVRSSGTVRLYLNGAEDGSGTLDGSIIGDVNWGIGSAVDDPTEAFNGYIALPFVANAGWSIAQVKNFYNATKGFFWPR